MDAGVFAVILAAGTSSRMGRTKQLLDWGGVPLLQAVIRKVLVHPFSEVIAVIGYRAAEIQRAIRIDDGRFRWVVNGRYSSGQSSSLARRGEIRKGPFVDDLFGGFAPCLRTGPSAASPRRACPGSGDVVRRSPWWSVRPFGEFRATRFFSEIAGGSIGFN